MRNSTQNESRIFVAKTESLNFNVSTGFFFSNKFTFDQLLCPSGRTSPTFTTATVRSSETERSSERTISTISTTFIYYPEKVKREAASRRVNDSGESFYRDCTVPLVVLIGVVIGIIIVVVILVVLKITNK